MAAPTIFISYSRKDEAWKDKVVSQLRVLEWGEQLEIWDDQRIGPGVDWEAEILAALGTAHVAVLLISPEYLGSEFIRQVEVPEILKRREQEGLHVVPVLVIDCLWETEDWLRRMQILPKNARPLSTIESRADTELKAIAEEILRLVETPATREPERKPQWLLGFLAIVLLLLLAAWGLGSHSRRSEVLTASTNEGKATYLELFPTGRAFLATEGRAIIPLDVLKSGKLISVLLPDEIAATNLLRGSVWLRSEYQGSCGGRTILVSSHLAPSPLSKEESKKNAAYILRLFSEDEPPHESLRLMTCFGYFESDLVPVGDSYYTLKMSDFGVELRLVQQVDCSPLTVERLTPRGESSHTCGDDSNPAKWRVSRGRQRLTVATTDDFGANGLWYYFSMEIDDVLYVHYNETEFGRSVAETDFPVVLLNEEGAIEFRLDGEEPCFSAYFCELKLPASSPTASRGGRKAGLE